jgi:hypothetical protein
VTDAAEATECTQASSVVFIRFPFGLPKVGQADDLDNGARFAPKEQQLPLQSPTSVLRSNASANARLLLTQRATLIPTARARSGSRSALTVATLRRSGSLAVSARPLVHDRSSTLLTDPQTEEAPTVRGPLDEVYLDRLLVSP